MDKIKSSVLKILFLFSVVLFIIYFLDKGSSFQEKFDGSTYLAIENEENNLSINDNKDIETDIETEEEPLKEDKLDVKIGTNSTEKDIVKEHKEDNKQEIVSRGKENLETVRPNNIDNKYLNNYVLDILKSYKGNDYPYLLNNDYQNYNGVTEDIYYNGELILKSHPSGKKYSHCTGITLEVFYKAMQKRNSDYGISIDNFNNMSSSDFRDFMLLWYVAMGAKSEGNLVTALEKYGIGKEIVDLEEVKAGDFLDISRENNTGHTVVFINWIRENNKIIGFKYWSSQDSTQGISYKEEYFNIKNSSGNKYGNVIIDDLHIGRIYPISEYKGTNK